MKPQFVKRAFVYQLESTIVCCPVSRCFSGGGIATIEIFRCENIRSVDVGKCLTEALKRSVDNIPDQSVNPKDHRDALVKASGLSSWRAFHSKAKLVVAYQTPGSQKVMLTPTRAEGGQGSAHLDEKQRHSSTLLSELGSAVLAALADAE
jgi:hypothetical protein